MNGMDLLARVLVIVILIVLTIWLVRTLVA